MKAYKDEKDKVWLFRPDQNFKRINRSSERLQIPQFPEEYFFEGLNTLLNLDQEWIKPGIGNSLYVRPFIFANQAGVAASASNRWRSVSLAKSPLRIILIATSSPSLNRDAR